MPSDFTCLPICVSANPEGILFYALPPMSRWNFFLEAPASLNPKLKNFSKESHYEALVSRALHGSWCRNPELDAVDRLHFCFVESIFQNQKIKSNKSFSALQKSKFQFPKIKNKKIQRLILGLLPVLQPRLIRCFTQWRGYNRAENHKTDGW